MGNLPSVPTAGLVDDPTTQTDCERHFAEVLAGIVGTEHVSVDSHFFDDLGADSMLMARFCARVRKRDDLPAASMQDVYQHPTIRSLAAALADDEPTPVPANHLTPTTQSQRALAEVLAGIVGTEHVSVDSHFFDDLGADSMLMARFCARVRKRDDLPAASMQDVYQHPTIRSLAAALADEEATPVPANHLSHTTQSQRALAEVLAGIVGTEHVSVDSHFFDDLGADSMLMARFCARVRKRDDLPAVSMQDVYQHPTIRSLAAALAPSPATSTDPTARPPVPAVPAALSDPPRRASTAEYVLCGALQVLFILGYPALIVVVAVVGYEWVSADPSLVQIYLRAVAFGAAMFLGLCIVPILIKWVLIGRWKPQEIRIWSMAYLRFWFVRTLVQRSPMALFLGSPLYAVYLRALGAKVGRGAVILARAPACTDLFYVGDRAVIRKDSVLLGYRADDGVIRTGAVSIGKDALVGESAVLDIWTSLGDGSQLGHSSALQAGQTVPDGERWHGSPAEPTVVDYRRVPTMKLRTWRPAIFGTVQLANVLLLGAPLAYIIAILAFKIPHLSTLMDAGPVAFDSWWFYERAMIMSAVLFFGAALLGLVLVRLVPRALNLFIEPDKVYPLYGFHYWVHRAIARTSNSKFYMQLFGDTSYIVHYLRWVGYDLQTVRQTGSNFGEAVKHDTPFLITVGSGTVVADGLSMMNADFSDSSFRLSRVSLGAESFLGNRIAYPAQSRAGDNCLLATRVMIPVDGPMREGVGLLGSPSFEIPRSVERDRQLDVDNPEDLQRGLHAKNIHNTITMTLMMLARLILVFAVMVLAMAAVDLRANLGVRVFALASVAVLIVDAGYNILLDRLVRPLMALRPQGCSIYDRAFWGHERYWKMASITYLQLFSGTPVRPVLLRVLGARVGRRVFDDGVGMPERKFVTIGDNCTLNAGSVIQCHSQEDGGFKSDRSELGAGCTLGPNSWVHYGVTMGDGAKLAAGSFLMKGEEVPPHDLWGGNPAGRMRELPGHLPVPRAALEGDRGAVLVHASAPTGTRPTLTMGTADGQRG